MTVFLFFVPSRWRAGNATQAESWKKKEKKIDTVLIVRNIKIFYMRFSFSFNLSNFANVIVVIAAAVTVSKTPPISFRFSFLEQKKIRKNSLFIFILLRATKYCFIYSAASKETCNIHD